jgi:antitoxin FitA
MATLTIRNLEDLVKQRLRIQAASHNLSMEEEARRILRKAVQEEPETEGLGTHIHKRFSEFGGIDLPVPERTQVPGKPETFE